MAVVDKKSLEYIPNIDRMIREKECRELTTLVNSTRWKLERKGKFPKRIKIGATTVAYRLSEVQAWIRGVNWIS
ncbi:MULTISPECIES: helix-turn-helix transcriptional regulator [Klebsiella pneumoniae complex]|uniref:helix-turn-helix transcriptional regulator n=1 Tax=Klebsiella pneumoniae complex TaxID=3390273 RepID=UPI001CCC1537|nr:MULTISPECIES: AlpA family phage regulatory protein [Klebsiella]MBZ7296943.1 AlpA family phage regulatory protein [Klebsiella variicola]